MSKRAVIVVTVGRAIVDEEGNIGGGLSFVAFEDKDLPKRNEYGTDEVVRELASKALKGMFDYEDEQTESGGLH